MIERSDMERLIFKGVDKIMGRKTCRNCQHDLKKPGHDHLTDQGQRRSGQNCLALSEVSSAGEKENWNEYVMPDVCGQYKPSMVASCTYCQKEINVEEYLWERWVGIGSRPVCSADCGAKLEAGEIGYFFSD